MKDEEKKLYYILLCSTECVQVIVLMRHIVSLHSVVFIEIHSHTHTHPSILLFFCTLAHSHAHTLFQAWSFASSPLLQITRCHFYSIFSFLTFHEKKCVPYVCRAKRNNNNNKQIRIEDQQQLITSAIQLNCRVFISILFRNLKKHMHTFRAKIPSDKRRMETQSVQRKRIHLD